MTELETSLKAAEAEAAKVKPLQDELVALQKSSAEEKHDAIKTTTHDLQTKHDQDLHHMKTTHEAKLHEIHIKHEKDLTDIKAHHEKEKAKLKDPNIHAEFRQMKTDFDKEKVEIAKKAREEGVRQARGEMAREIHSLQTSHTAEKAKLQTEHHKHLEKFKSESATAHQKALEKQQAEHKKETDAVIAKRDEIQKKANGEMKTLSDAHTTKTAALEASIAEATAAAKAADERARKAGDLEHRVEEQGKELSATKAELETAKQKLAELESKYDQLSLAYFETG
jgi:hypothetical protein